MTHALKRLRGSSPLRSSILALAVALMAACAGTDGTHVPREDDSPDLSCVQVGATTAYPSTLVGLASNLDLATATVRMVDPVVSDLTQLLVRKDATTDTASFALIAPFHPHSLTDGGTVVLEFILNETTSCTASLVITPLPTHEAPGVAGSYARQVTGLQRTIESMAIEFGLDPALLRRGAEDLPLEALPLFAAQFLLDHPDNPHDLMTMMQEGVVWLSADTDPVPVDMRLLDRIYALHGANGELAMLDTDLALSGGPCLSPQLGTAGELLFCLNRQATAMRDAEFLSIGTKTAAAMTTVLVFIPGAQVAAAIWAKLMLPGLIRQAAHQMLADLLPNGFDISFDVTHPEVDIGEYGRWHRLALTPSGNRFRVTDVVFGVISIYTSKLSNTYVKGIATYLGELLTKAVSSALGIEPQVGPISYAPIPIDDEHTSDYVIATSTDTRVFTVLAGTTRGYVGESWGTARLSVCPGGSKGLALNAASSGGSPCSVTTIKVRSAVPDVLVGTFTFEHQLQYTQRHSPEIRHYNVDRTQSWSMSITLELVRQGLNRTGLERAEILDGRHGHSYRVARVFDAAYTYQRDWTTWDDVGELGSGFNRSALTGPIDSWDNHTMMMLWAPPQGDAPAHTNWIQFSMAEFYGQDASIYDFGWVARCSEPGGPSWWGKPRHPYTYPLDFDWSCGVTPEPITPLGYAFDPKGGYSGGYSNSYTYERTEADLIFHTTAGVVTAYWDFESK